MRANLGFMTLVGIVLMLGCQSSGWRVISPGIDTHRIYWSEEDRQKDYAIKTVKKTSESSHHYVRLKTAEKPHIHAQHDLLVVVLRGEAKVHFESRSVTLEPGDVIDIPRGTYHWAENLGRNASEVYVIFTPPFNGEDIVLVD